jgi:hypothetical protein
MFLTNSSIDQALAQVCAACSPFPRLGMGISTVKGDFSPAMIEYHGMMQDRPGRINENKRD